MRFIARIAAAEFAAACHLTEGTKDVTVRSLFAIVHLMVTHGLEKTMSNPYVSQPDYAFWRRSVAGVPVEDVDPITSIPFRIDRADRISTAGSCFAQHISNTLVNEGFCYFVTEQAPATSGAENENFGTFPARFGNIYSARQLLQLFQRAYGLFEPLDEAWQRADGKYVDPFRPQIQSQGFDTIEDLHRDRQAHFIAVRAMFEQCNVFIFTLGLTEAWAAGDDAAVFPLAPGVVAPGRPDASYTFRNFAVSEMTSDIEACFSLIREVNPSVRFVLTVSPVPLIATFERRHVLVSTIYSKSALRVVAEEISSSLPNVAYFPSYEIITGSYARSQYFAEDLREVTPQGVSKVMSLFKKHYLGTGTELDTTIKHPTPSLKSQKHDPVTAQRTAIDNIQALQAIICDEEALDPG